MYNKFIKKHNKLRLFRKIESSQGGAELESIGTRTFVFLTGCFIYSLLEIASRGFTHWTMTLTGGVILTILFEMFIRLKAVPMWQKCILGAALITSVEFTVGVIVNIILGWGVWDYSDMPFNVLGQICLPFTVLWFFLCIPAGFVCNVIKNKLK